LFGIDGFEIMAKIMFKKIISPILDRLDSETWHNRVRELLHLSEISPLTLRILELFAYKSKRLFNERLKVKIADIEFDNPLLVGAGWDKTGRAVKGLYTLGFAGVEVGTVLQYPQPGNEKPRQFVIGPGVVLNRLGFNSPGMNVVAKNLEK
jgi:dihydroorotate dehydrogenase